MIINSGDIKLFVNVGTDEEPKWEQIGQAQSASVAYEQQEMSEPINPKYVPKVIRW